MNDRMKSLLDLAGGGKKVPVLNLVRDNPNLAAVLSKLVTPAINPQYGTDGRRQVTNPDQMHFRAIGDAITNNINDSETIMQLLPEIAFWKQILISSILSPKDMMTTELTFIPPEDLLGSDVSGALINRIKQYFEKTYKIKPMLSKILEDALFDTGSYPLAIIPENSLDALINGNTKISMESLKTHVGDKGEFQPIGLLGPVKKSTTPADARMVSGIAIESINFRKETKTSAQVLAEMAISIESSDGKTFDTCITVSDNYNLFKVPQLNARLREQQVQNAIGMRSMENPKFALESAKLTDSQLSGLVYKTKGNRFTPLTIMQTQEQVHRKTVGEPLIMHISSESVIPVHIRSSPEKQIGFFVLIDAEGNPLSRYSPDDQFRQLSSRRGSSAGLSGMSFPQAMNDRIKGMMGGNEANFSITNGQHIDYSARAYGELIEADLLERLRNGVYGNGVAIASNQEIYRIMLARTLQKEATQLLYLPIELMTYFALDFNNQGIGKSLIDDMRILLSFRVQLMFAEVMSSMKNSIGRTKANMKLDPDDPDPKKSMEMMAHEIMRSRQSYFPIGAINPSDIVDSIQRAGIEITFEGHPGVPDVSVEFNEHQTQYAKPDSELSETLRKQSILAAGLSPENVDAGFGAEYATSILANNVLLSKRVVTIQDKFVPQIADACRKIIRSSQDLSDDLRSILKENIAKVRERLDDSMKDVSDEYIIEVVFNDFTQMFEVALPTPNSATLENQMAAFKLYSEALDQALDAYISDKFMNDTTGGEVANNVSVIKEVVRAYYLRKWFTDNGVLTELSALTTCDESGQPMIDFFAEQASHIESLAKSLTSLMVKLQPPKEENAGELENNGVTATAAPEPEEGGGEGGGDDLGGDMNFDMGGDAEATPEGTPEETPNPEETPKSDENPEAGEVKPEEKPNEEPEAKPE